MDGGQINVNNTKTTNGNSITTRKIVMTTGLVESDKSLTALRTTIIKWGFEVISLITCLTACMFFDQKFNIIILGYPQT